MTHKKYHTPRRELMAYEKIKEPETKFTQLEYEDNSEIIKALEDAHPRIIAFERKYQDVNWRANLK